jgi:hypothetical protein
VRETLMTLRTYQITFNSAAVPAIVAAFEDFDVVVGDGSTTLRGDCMDQAALHGAIDRLQDLGLELLQVSCAEDADSGDPVQRPDPVIPGELL